MLNSEIFVLREWRRYRIQGGLEQFVQFLQWLRRERRLRSPWLPFAPNFLLWWLRVGRHRFDGRWPEEIQAYSENWHPEINVLLPEEDWLDQTFFYRIRNYPHFPMWWRQKSHPGMILHWSRGNVKIPVKNFTPTESSSFDRRLSRWQQGVSPLYLEWGKRWPVAWRTGQWSVRNLGYRIGSQEFPRSLRERQWPKELRAPESQYMPGHLQWWKLGGTEGGNERQLQARQKHHTSRKEFHDGAQDSEQWPEEQYGRFGETLPIFSRWQRAVQPNWRKGKMGLQSNWRGLENTLSTGEKGEQRPALVTMMDYASFGLRGVQRSLTGHHPLMSGQWKPLARQPNNAFLESGEWQDGQREAPRYSIVWQQGGGPYSIPQSPRDYEDLQEYRERRLYLLRSQHRRSLSNTRADNLWLKSRRIPRLGAQLSSKRDPRNHFLPYYHQLAITQGLSSQERPRYMLWWNGEVGLSPEINRAAQGATSRVSRWEPWTERRQKPSYLLLRQDRTRHEPDRQSLKESRHFREFHPDPQRSHWLALLSSVGKPAYWNRKNIEWLGLDWSRQPSIVTAGKRNQRYAAPQTEEQWRGAQKRLAVLRMRRFEKHRGPLDPWFWMWVQEKRRPQLRRQESTFGNIEGWRRLQWWKAQSEPYGRMQPINRNMPLHHDTEPHQDSRYISPAQKDAMIDIWLLGSGGPQGRYKIITPYIRNARVHRQPTSVGSLFYLPWQQHGRWPGNMDLWWDAQQTGGPHGTRHNMLWSVQRRLFGLPGSWQVENGKPIESLQTPRSAYPLAGREEYNIENGPEVARAYLLWRGQEGAPSLYFPCKERGMKPQTNLQILSQGSSEPAFIQQNRKFVPGSRHVPQWLDRGLSGDVNWRWQQRNKRPQTSPLEVYGSFLPFEQAPGTQAIAMLPMKPVAPQWRQYGTRPGHSGQLEESIREEPPPETPMTRHAPHLMGVLYSRNNLPETPGDLLSRQHAQKFPRQMSSTLRPVTIHLGEQFLNPQYKYAFYRQPAFLGRVRGTEEPTDRLQWAKQAFRSQGRPPITVPSSLPMRQWLQFPTLARFQPTIRPLSILRERLTYRDNEAAGTRPARDQEPPGYLTALYGQDKQSRHWRKFPTGALSGQPIRWAYQKIPYWWRAQCGSCAQEYGVPGVRYKIICLQVPQSTNVWHLLHRAFAGLDGNE